VAIGRRKDGRYYRKRPRRARISSSDVFPDLQPSKPTTYFSRDDYIRQNNLPKKILAKPTTKEERKEDRFHRVASLNLGDARQFLILSTSVLVQLDPTLATIYTTWKFGKYGYEIYKKVKREYDIKGDYNQALQKVVTQEIEEKVVSKIKSIPINNVSQFAANKIWEYHRGHNPETDISPELEKFAINAMTKTFEEVGAKAL